MSERMTVIVEVPVTLKATTKAGLRAALKELRHDPPFIDVVTVDCRADKGTYSYHSLKRCTIRSTP